MHLLYPDEDFSYLLTGKGDLFLKYLFDKYYTELCRLSFKYVGRTDVAEDLVQDVFINIWNKRHALKYTGNIKPCLTTSVINASINYIKSKFARQLIVDDSYLPNHCAGTTPHDEIITQDLHELLKIATAQLPDKCRTIFMLSRFSGKSQKEIAEELNVSVKTVENQITIAIKKIKEFLVKYGYFLLVFFS